MAIAFTNGRVLTETGLQSGLAVLVEGDRIAGVVAAGDPRLRAAQARDLNGRLLLPGFIDCQVNGGGGVLFNDDPSLDTVQRIATAHRTFGTTALLPTLISDDLAKMRAAMAAVKAALDAQVPGVLGIHLEGPFLSPERRGVHDAAHFRQPDSATLDLICSLGAGRTLLTVAPERVSPQTITQLTQRGVIVALGHSAASYAVARAALDAGARGFTHLFNAMSPLQSREPGMVGAALEDRASFCGLIVDGHHFHAAAARVALAAKPAGTIFLVTDAMPPVGSAQSTFRLGNETIECREGACLTAQGVLAGSSLDMARAVRNTVQLLGLDVAEAARMASTYPATFLGVAASHGRIVAGARADLVVMGEQFVVEETWIGGRL